MDGETSAPAAQHRTEIACSSFFVGKWVGSPDQAWEPAVGQEFARALLLALWEKEFTDKAWARCK